MKIIAFALLSFTFSLPQASAEEFAPFTTQVLYKEQCSECHGTNGISRLDRYPNVAGQKRGYLQAEMLAFKSGARPGTIMPAIAQSLTEKEIEDLSLYMSKMKCAP